MRRNSCFSVAAAGAAGAAVAAAAAAVSTAPIVVSAAAETAPPAALGAERRTQRCTINHDSSTLTPRVIGVLRNLLLVALDYQ